MMFEGLGSVSWLPIAVFVLANENRTQDAGHALLRQTRNPKVRKKSGVICRPGLLRDSDSIDASHGLARGAHHPAQAERPAQPDAAHQGQDRSTRAIAPPEYYRPGGF